ncbi:unnamed protein product [Fusarium langsethiae]|nr:unnamed protein product [Fusarium langsethiae]GKU20953.1 unnamed protein product [Fusarium langsethiae]
MSNRSKRNNPAPAPDSVLTDAWNKKSPKSGFVCLKVDNSTPAFDATWNWDKNIQDVHSFPYVRFNHPDLPIRLSNLESIRLSTDWIYTAGNPSKPPRDFSSSKWAENKAQLNSKGVQANAAWDFFLDDDRNSTLYPQVAAVEIMVWLGSVGNPWWLGRVNNSIISTVTLGETDFSLFYGRNSGGTHVFTAVTKDNSDILSFSEDFYPLFKFVLEQAHKHIDTSVDLPENPWLGIIEFGTETWLSNGNATFTAANFAMDLKGNMTKNDGNPTGSGNGGNKTSGGDRDKGDNDDKGSGNEDGDDSTSKGDEEDDIYLSARVALVGLGNPGTTTALNIRGLPNPCRPVDLWKTASARLYDISDALVAAGNYTFNPPAYEINRRSHRIKRLLAPKLRDELQIRLPPETLMAVAGLLVRECAAITAKEQSLGTDVSDIAVNLTQDVYVRYTNVDGVRYVKSLDNTASELCDQDRHMLLSKQGEPVRKIWIDEDYRGIRFVKLSTADATLAEPTPIAKSWWRAIYVQCDIENIIIKSDGLKLRDIILCNEKIPNDAGNYVGWSNPEHPNNVIDITTFDEVNSFPERLRMTFFNCNASGTSGYTAVTCGSSAAMIHAHENDNIGFYADMDSAYPRGFFIYMPLDNGEFVTEICRRYALAAGNQISACLVDPYACTRWNADLVQRFNIGVPEVAQAHCSGWSYAAY